MLQICKARLNIVFQKTKNLSKENEQAMFQDKLGNALKNAKQRALCPLPLAASPPPPPPP